MRNTFVWKIAIASLLVAGAAMAAELPHWAYGFTGPGAPTPPAGGAAAPAPDTSVKHLPGSKLEFTRQQIANRFGPADWYPEDHGAMPPVVAKGKEPNVYACSLCHYPNGKGRPEGQHEPDDPVRQEHDGR
jgi:hypothetical protein